MGSDIDMVIAAQQGGSGAFNLLLLLAVPLVFYFLLIRPQMRQAKLHREKIGGLKRGDQVVTAGGLVGKVLKVDDNYVELELGKGVQVKAVKHTIGDVIPPAGSAAND